MCAPEGGLGSQASTDGVREKMSQVHTPLGSLTTPTQKAGGGGVLLRVNPDREGGSHLGDPLCLCWEGQPLRRSG